MRLSILFFFSILVLNAVSQDSCLIDNNKESSHFDQNEILREASYLSSRSYIIPTIVHVFHNRAEGLLSKEQVQSGLDVINRDFQGLNSDWELIEPEFDSIKASFSFELKLATIDEYGSETTGIIYYDDSIASRNGKDLFVNGWDNYKYLNIYLPIYAYGGPSMRTAYATLPSGFDSNRGSDGIYYSSVRWGYGENSELEDGSELASIATHEIGHWLNLRHTFNNECESPGDFVDDTPPVLETQINFLPCDEVPRLGCSVNVNFSNYMDYNHGCKKMFTKGQVQRMVLALQRPERAPIWALQNLYETGVIPRPNDLVSIAFDPVKGYSFLTEEDEVSLNIYNISGQLEHADVIQKGDVYLLPLSFTPGQIKLFVFKTKTRSFVAKLSSR